MAQIRFRMTAAHVEIEFDEFESGKIVHARIEGSVANVKTGKETIFHKTCGMVKKVNLEE